MSILWVLPITFFVLGVFVIAARTRVVVGEIYDSIAAFDDLRLALQPATVRARADLDLTRGAFSEIRADWRTFTRR